jgi:hypothetical protein
MDIPSRIPWSLVSGQQSISKRYMDFPQEFPRAWLLEQQSLCKRYDGYLSFAKDYIEDLLLHVYPG